MSAFSKGSADSSSENKTGSSPGKTCDGLSEVCKAIKESELREVEKKLLDTLNSEYHQQLEDLALTSASKAVLQNCEFMAFAGTIFRACKELLCASAGYVALFSGDGKTNEVLFLDEGGFPCRVNPSLSMSLRGLLAETNMFKSVIYENDFFRTKYVRLLPAGHIVIKNVLFLPLTEGRRTVGIIGLANKHGDFNEHDAEIASAFGEIASIALLSSLAFIGSLEAAARKRTTDEAALKRVNNALEDRVLALTTELQEKKNLLEASEKIAHLGSWKFDITTNSMSWSNEVYKIFGLTIDEFGGTYEAFLERVYPEDRAAVDAAYHGLIRESNDTYEMEHRIIIKQSGEVRWVFEKCEYLRDASGKITESIGMVQDMTERKKAEEDIGNSQIQMYIYLENCGVPAFITNPEGNYVYVSQSASKLLQYTLEELLKMNISQLLFKGDIDEKLRNFSKLKENGRFREQLRLRRKDGTPVIVDLNAVRLPNHLLVAFCDDITGREKAEAAVRESETRLRTITENTPDPIYIKDRNSCILMANPACERALGKTIAELRGKDGTEFFADPVIGKAIVETDKRVMESGKSQIVEEDIDTPFGRRIYLSTKTPLFNAQGKVTGIMGISRDITERKKAEQELIDSRKKLELLIESMDDGFAHLQAVYDENRSISDLLILDVNSSFGLISGLKLEEHIGKTWESIDCQLPQNVIVACRKVDLTGKSFKFESNTAQSNSWYRVNVYPIAKGDFGVLFYDITENKRKEIALKRQTLKFRLEDGNVYRAEERTPLLALEAFDELQKIGYQGVAISRTTESDLRKLIGQNPRFNWLAERGKNLTPKIEEIKKVIEAYQNNVVFLIDGLDYLTLKWGNKNTIFLLQWMKDFAALTGNIILVLLNSSTFKLNEYHLIERETKTIELNQPLISKKLLEILKFIGSQNKKGIDPKYSDIRVAMCLSKPTVAKRLKSLIVKGCVTERVMGRQKVLHLTSVSLNILG